jgi:hypothetical protein
VVDRIGFAAAARPEMYQAAAGKDESCPAETAMSAVVVPVEETGVEVVVGVNASEVYKG